VVLAVVACLCSSTASAVDNDLDLNGFVAPVVVPISDASIVVGDPVWRSADGKVYVVQTKTAANATLLDVKTAGMGLTVTVTTADRVIEIAHLTIDIPGTPAATASTP
jgi:hypothetical protein